MEAGNAIGDGKRVAFFEMKKKVRSKVGRSVNVHARVTILSPSEEQVASTDQTADAENGEEEKKEEEDNVEVEETVDAESIAKQTEEMALAQARKEWTRTFLENGGFDYVRDLI